jgi:hypothetical protein
VSPPLLLPLVAEAARRSRVCWLSYTSGETVLRDRLVWHAWHEDALLVLSDDDEQVLPGIETADLVEVSLRSKDTGGRLVTWSAPPVVLSPSAPAWEDHARALLAVRLNLPDPGATLDTWRHGATLVRLAPSPEALDEGARPLP